MSEPTCTIEEPNPEADVHAELYEVDTKLNKGRFGWVITKTYRCWGCHKTIIAEYIASERDRGGSGRGQIEMGLETGKPASDGAEEPGA